MFLVGYIFNFPGAFVRWTFGSVWRTIANNKKYRFREYLIGPDNSDDWFDLTGHDLINKVIGGVAIVTVIILLNKIFS